jgi:hypothetical protein
MNNRNRNDNGIKALPTFKGADVQRVEGAVVHLSVLGHRAPQKRDVVLRYGAAARVRAILHYVGDVVPTLQHQYGGPLIQEPSGHHRSRRPTSDHDKVVNIRIQLYVEEERASKVPRKDDEGNQHQRCQNAL